MMIIPKILEIEIARGFCTASCPMCSIDETKYNKSVMTFEKLKTIIDNFGEDIKHIEKIIFCGLGEVLLDKQLEKKIEYVKSKGVDYVSIPSNASLLTKKTSLKLLNSGLNEVLIGMDSMKKKLFEEIRKDLIFEEILSNTHSHIKIRNKHNFNSKIIVRMILTEKNRDEWNDYVDYWSKYLDFNKKDMILYFPEHNWSDHDYPNSDNSSKIIPKNNKCSYVYDRINIDAHGNIKFCCIDINASFFDLGNACFVNPMELYNKEIFSNSRKLMDQGKINEIKPCRTCNVPILRSQRGFGIDKDVKVTQ